MRKLTGTARVETTGAGRRLILKAQGGEEVCMDLNPEAAAKLSADLSPPKATKPAKGSL